MRIVIDMQGAQSESRFRGIGCYTMAFAQAVVRNCGEHEVILAVSGLFPETIEPIRAAFDKLLPQNNIRVWYTPGPVLERHTGNDDTRKIAELIREDFIEKLQPDVVHVTSLFEGYIDDAVTSTRNLGQKTIISVTTYDLIPLLNPQQYLDPHPIYKTYYHRKIEELKKADVLLAISEYAKTEIIDSGLVSESKVFNVSTAIDDSFEKCTYSKDEKRSLNSKFNIKGEFILYTGGADERKNLPRLIEAYALLSEQLRKEHQLVFAGRMPSGDIDRFKAIAKSHGLKSEDILFTGYIEQEELIALYNLCKLYVFPSWHEGFGLPALEAMSCGAPVIGANTTSLPEVIGFEDALFDPMNVSQINQKMKLALTDSDYRKSLCENASNQVGKFSWDITAKKAIEAWESLYKSNKLSTENAVSAECYSLIEKITPYINPKDENRIREISSHLAHNEGVGVQRQLLLDISELYHRDAATGVQRVVRNYLYHLLNCPPKDFEVLPVYAKQDQGYYYAFDYVEKLLGHQVSKLENTPIRIQRGDVFFGLDMQHHVQLAHVSTYEQLRQSGVVIKFLVHDLLPIQLSELFKDNDAKELHEKWLRMIAQQDEAICVSKATADAFEEWITTYSARTKANFQISWVHNGADINESQFIPETSEETKVLGKLKSRPTFLCVSTIEPRKGQEQILDAFELLWQEEQFDFNLVFVGQQGWNVDKLASRLSNHSENGHRLFWLQGINDSYLNRVYQASTCLLAASINEGFGLSLIEAASHKIPVIARDIPVFREVAGDAAFYFKGETGEELAISIESWFQSLNKGEVPNSSNMKWSTWQESSEKLKVQLVENNCPQKQLLVDVSELVKRDAKTGIQRVVREILKHWLSNPPSGYQVVPVYATTDALGYRYAHNFLNQFLQLHQTREIEDTFVDVWQGDMFVGLDLQHAVLSTQFELLKDWRNRGVKIWFVIYDLLPVLLPQYFPPESEQYHQEWLELVSEFDGVACISESVAGEYQEWLDKQGETQRLRPIKIKSFPLGVDQKSSLNTKGIPDDGNVVLDAISSSNSFLMVGTIEPRKGHVQVLDAFEHLWAEGGEQTLVIVGKKGWMVDPLMKRLENHSQLRKRLFIISNCSDEYLEKIYEKSKCLIAASYGEGFGLPLIEAAKHNLPIIARDIPVFREVAGSNAQFFKGDTGQELLHAIYDWLEDYHNRNHVSSRNIKWVTWEESSFILISILN